MTEIKFQKRVVYARDVYIALLKAGWSVRDAADFATDLPTADVQPVRRGKWIWWAHDGHLRCSECKQKAPVSPQCQGDPLPSSTNFCPHCGANMGYADNGQE